MAQVKERKKEICGGLFKYTNKDGIKLSIGTINKYECTSVYVKIDGWISVDDELKTILKTFNQRYRSEWYKYTKDTFKRLKSSIFTIDNAEGAYAKTSKTTFITLEFTLFGEFDWTSRAFQGKLKDYGLTMIDKIIDSGDFILTSYRK